MAYDVSQIIPITARIVPNGIATANFAEALMFAPQTELPVGFLPDTYRTYTSLTALAVDFPDTTETYKAMARWLGGTPATRKVKVWGAATADATITATLNKARNVLWWYWSFFTKSVYADATKVGLIAAWHGTADAYFVNCQTGKSATDIRTPATTTDIASVLTTAGHRHTTTVSHATDPYAGIALCKHFAAVNYSAANSTITGEFKKSPGVAAEDLTDTAYDAMKLDTKKCAFYSLVELQGSTDVGRWANTWSHSSYGEWMDDVVNLDAFVNALKVALYNAAAGQVTKLAQTPVGQAVLIGAARAVCEQYITNNYMGPRNYTDPDDGLEKYTVGYEILTKPEDILDLSDADRDARKSAAIRIRIFRAGAIHSVPVDIDIY